MMALRTKLEKGLEQLRDRSINRMRIGSQGERVKAIESLNALLRNCSLHIDRTLPQRYVLSTFLCLILL